MAYCFDIGGSNIRLGLPTATGEVPVVASVATPTDSFDAFCQAICQLIEQHGDGQRETKVEGQKREGARAITFGNSKFHVGVVLVG